MNSGLMLMNSSENAEMASLAATTPSTMRHVCSNTRHRRYLVPSIPAPSRLRILAPARVVGQRRRAGWPSPPDGGREPLDVETRSGEREPARAAAGGGRGPPRGRAFGGAPARARRDHRGGQPPVSRRARPALPRGGRRLRDRLAGRSISPRATTTPWNIRICVTGRPSSDGRRWPGRRCRSPTSWPTPTTRSARSGSSAIERCSAFRSSSTTSSSGSSASAGASRGRSPTRRSSSSRPSPTRRPSRSRTRGCSTPWSGSGPSCPASSRRRSPRSSPRSEGEQLLAGTAPTSPACSPISAASRRSPRRPRPRSCSRCSARTTRRSAS